MSNMTKQETSLKNKQLFEKYKRLIIPFVNSPLGRGFTGISHHQEIRNKEIVAVTPNSIIVPASQGGYLAITRGYELFAKKLTSALLSIEIFEDWLQEKQRKLIPRASLLSHFLGINPQSRFPTIMLDSATTYSSAGDGATLAGPEATWSAVRDKEDANSTSTTNTEMNIVNSLFAGPAYYCERIHIVYDTSFIGSGGTVSACTQNLYQTTKGISNALTVAIQEDARADPASLSASDYGAITLNTPTEWATRVAAASISDNAYFTHTFNATGLAGVSVTGFTKICARGGSRDVDNLAPTAENIYRISTSEIASTTQDPYLSITYTPAPRGDASYSFFM